MAEKGALMKVAPRGPLTRYDQINLALYAELLDAEAAGRHWQDVASALMQLDPEQVGTQHCWHSHLERARWIASDGLAQAIHAFGRPDS
ncbi:hypothetical protein [Sphingomonas sp. SKA58]|uniref:hypothetical protein n=1 Tax=Sphingomonas sp. (strain SKA58) TaxID=314266 RepID=UPI001E39BC94|nr:hypothetical protein [Sphingomonas sp. SKA58]